MQINEEVELETVVYRSRIDGMIVVEIDTGAEVGDLRINLNDGTIWEGDPESTTSARELLIQIEKARFETNSVRDGEKVADADALFRSRVEKILYDATVRQWERRP